MSDVYWRIQRDAEAQYHVCCLQDFDEKDYDKDLWVKVGTTPMKFTSQALVHRVAPLLQNMETELGYTYTRIIAIELYAMYDGIKEEPTNPFEGE